MNPPKQTPVRGQMRWMVDLREFNAGRRFFKTEKEALDFTEETVKEHNEHGQKAFDLPHETRLRYLAAEVRLADIGMTLEDCLALAEKANKPSSKKAIGLAAKECVEKKRAAGRRERAMDQLSYALNGLVESVGAQTLCSDVTTEQIDAWLHNPKWEMSTRKSRLIDARSFFAFCMKRGWCLKNPAKQVEEISVDTKPPGILTVDQVKRLLMATLATRPDFLPFIVLGVFCGVRPDEIKQLSWSNVDLDQGYVRIPAHIAKRTRRGNRRERLIKLQPNAIAWLKLKGELPPESWQDRFDVVRKAAGFAVTVRRKSGRAKRGKPCAGDLWPRNCMRHSFCSYCLAKFSEADEARWSGHSPEEAVAKYKALVTPEQAELFWSIFPPDSPTPLPVPSLARSRPLSGSPAGSPSSLP